MCAGQRVFASDPAIVGRDVRVNGQPFVVIGVLAAGVRGLLPPMQSDMWVPLTMEPILKPGSKVLENRDAGRFHLLGRLRPGASVAEAQAELTSIARDLEQRYPETNRGRTVSVYPARPLVAGFETPVLAFTGFLMARAAALLLTAGVNIGSLLMARATERRAENGLRLALGATRWRLVRQHLVESLLLASASAAGGTLIAVAATRALRALEPPTPVPVGLDVRVDVRVDATVVLCAVVGGACMTVLMGLVPAMRSSRQELITGLRDGGGTINLPAVLVCAPHSSCCRLRFRSARSASLSYSAEAPLRRARGPRISTKRRVGAQCGPRDASVLTRARTSVLSKRAARVGRCSWRRPSYLSRYRSADAIGHGPRPAILRQCRNSGVVACAHECRTLRSQLVRETHIPVWACA